MRRAYIGFGANLANPADMLLRVVEALGEWGIIIDSVSRLWRSPAWPPGSDAPDYLNAVMAVRFDGKADDLMSLLLDIETSLGRLRSVRNAPRLVDLDIIDIPGERSDTDHVTVPHPRLRERAFVLKPLQEIDRDWVHPDGARIADLIAALGPSADDCQFVTVRS